MKGVIYARYSSDNQREESIDGQLRECKAFAVKNDIQILDTYIDRALSAKTDNRPDFQRMIKDSAKGGFEVVLVWKLDRFARNRYDSAHYKSVLRKNGVRVISATERISEGAEGILLESMLEGMAEYYSAELAEKVKRGMTENALKCKYNGGTLPVGYTVDENKFYQLDPVVAPIVADAFKHYAEGYTMREVVDELNLRGVRNTRGGKILSSRTASLPSSVKSYLSVYSREWHRQRKPLPSTRQRTSIYLPPSSTAVSADVSWSVKADTAKLPIPYIVITNVSVSNDARIAIRKLSRRNGSRISLLSKSKGSFIMTT